MANVPHTDTQEAQGSKASLPKRLVRHSSLDEEEFATLVGELYSRWTLDGLIEVGYVISLDFTARPQLYVGDDIPDTIGELRIAYGTNVHYQNTAERLSMMLPILGRSDGLKPDASVVSSSFHMARKKFIDACIAFSERAVDTGVAMLEDRVRSSLVPLRAHFDGLRGKAINLTSEKLTDVSDNVLRILRSSGVARVFGLTSAVDDWPFASVDPNGAKLVEAVGAALALPPDFKLSYTRFILLQRVAQEGGRALPLIFSVDPSIDSDLSALITQGYAWGSSLRDFQQAH